VAGSGALPRRAAEYGVFAGFRGLITSQAGRGAIIVPCWEGLEVALPRPCLVESPSGKFVEAHERVGSERGTVSVSVRVWGPDFPFFHKEIAAEPFELRVRAPWGNIGVGFTEKMLGGDGEGGQPVRS